MKSSGHFYKAGPKSEWEGIVEMLEDNKHFIWHRSYPILNAGRSTDQLDDYTPETLVNQRYWEAYFPNEFIDIGL